MASGSSATPVAPAPHALREAPAEADGDAGLPLPPGVRVHPHQVAGHRAEEGRTSALATHDGFFLKPLLPDARGACELALYERVAAAAAASTGDAGSLAALARFLPAFHGVAHPRGAAGGPHLRLSDATAALALPCVADIKIGFTTGDACFGEAYVAKCALKDGATTSRALGFRVAGMQHWQPGGAPSCAWACVRAERRWCKALDAAGAAAALARFSACGVADATTARAVATGVLRGPGGALSQLAALIAWFETQRELRFFGASVLLLFDAAPLAAAAADEARSISEVDTAALRVDVKFVDFGHVLPAGGARDENTLAGLRALADALEVAAPPVADGGG